MNEIAQYYKDINPSQKSTDLVSLKTLAKKKIMKIDNSKNIWKCQKKKIIAKTSLKKENKFEEIILPHTEIYYKAITIKKLVF